MLGPESPIRVRKLRPDGSEVFSWEGHVLSCDEQGLSLKAPFNVELVERDWVTLRRGDVFVEFYYWDRPYNVDQVSEPDGTLKGWYVNLALPAELDAAQGELRWVDLGLDVWVRPGGDYVVLDEED